MKSLIPATVMGRSALVLVAALAVALAGALMVFSAHRGEALLAQGLDGAAERVADVVGMAEGLPPALRSNFLSGLESPGFRVGWGSEPLADQQGDENPAAEGIAQRVRQRLAGHEVRVRTRSRAETGMGPLIRLSVQMSDGAWLNVTSPFHHPEPLFRARFLAQFLSPALIVAFAALWAVRRAVRPFATFAEAARRLGMDVAAPPIPVSGPREVRDAALAFNSMQASIRRFVDDRTQMLAAISHDLRTPITRLKLRAEFVEDESERARMLSDLDDMEKMIATTLIFARDDAAREERCPTDLAALLQGLIDDRVMLGGAINYHGAETLVVPVRPIALKRAVGNILDNAVTYGRSVTVRLEADENAVRIDVEDDGPGIKAADRERVFQPFVRLDPARSRNSGGAGLGLTVARAAVRAHGGDISLADAEGGGTRVTITLPVG